MSEQTQLKNRLVITLLGHCIDKEKARIKLVDHYDAKQIKDAYGLTLCKKKHGFLIMRFWYVGTLTKMN